MKKSKIIKKISAAIIAMSFCASAMPILPVNAALPDNDVIQPMNIAITSKNAKITVGNWRALTCEGKTVVTTGYTAGLTVELQEDSGSGWTTIKTWTSKGSTAVNISETYYGSSGCSYRLKNTHRAYNSAGTVVETLYTYSSTI